MYRRNILIVTTLLGLAIGEFPQNAFAQTDPFLGVWQVNLGKSKFSSALPFKSLTVYRSQGKYTEVGIDAEGNPFSRVFGEAIEEMGSHTQ